MKNSVGTRDNLHGDHYPSIAPNDNTSLIPIALDFKWVTHYLIDHPLCV